MPGGAGRLGDGAGAEDMDGVEALAAALGEDADEIDHRVGALDGAVDRPAIAEIGLHRLDPADHAERLEDGRRDRGGGPRRGRASRASGARGRHGGR